MPEIRPRTITITPEGAERFSIHPNSPTYRNNISQPLFHGPLVASHEANNSAITSYHTRPIDSHPTDSCEDTPPYHTPCQRTANDTAYISEKTSLISLRNKFSEQPDMITSLYSVGTMKIQTKLVNCT